MLKAIVNGAEKDIVRIPMIGDDSTYKEGWEIRDQQDRLIWGKNNTLTGVSSISFRGYGVPLKSIKIVGNTQQNGTPAPDAPVDVVGCGDRTANLFDNALSARVRWVVDGKLRKDLYTNSLIMPCEPETEYALSKILSNRFIVWGLRSYPVEGGTNYTELARGNDQTSLTFTTGSSDIYLLVMVSYNSRTPSISDIANSVMLNTGDTPLPYDPYGWKIPVTSAGQTQNVYLGQVQTVRRIKKLVLDGTESTWQEFNTLNLFRLPDTSQDYRMQDDGAICDSLPLVSRGDLTANTFCWSTGTIGELIININNYNLTDLKAYLSSNPITIWYVLAEPETAIVNEPLAKIGTYVDTLTSEQAGITIPTTDGNNIISVDTSLAPSKMTITGHIKPIKPIRYGFRIDKQDVNPDTRVTYLYDAVGMTPAYMDFASGTFNYGSWDDVWFVKNNRPVALKFDGTVDYELNHTDFTKKLDGTASDVSDSTYAGNFMSEMPTVYVKRWEDDRYNYIVFSDMQYDSDYQAQAHTNENGVVNSAIYLPMFKGSVDSNNKMRSIMGTYPKGNTTGTNEVAYASNCGTGWQIWDKAKIDLIMDLIVLITKSTNCRAKIGNGDCNTYNASTTNYGKMKSGYETDGITRSVNAQFYGSEDTNVSGYGKHHMSAFFIEDLWGNRWDRVLGFNLVNNVYKVKMTAPYNLDSDSSYETLSVLPPSNTDGWLNNISSGAYGDVPTEVGATNSTGFANYFYKNASGTRLSLFGGDCTSGLWVGRCWVLNGSSGDSHWSIGGSPCFNAL